MLIVEFSFTIRPSDTDLAVNTGAIEDDEGKATVLIIYTLSYHENGISRSLP